MQDLATKFLSRTLLGLLLVGILSSDYAFGASPKALQKFMDTEQPNLTISGTDAEDLVAELEEIIIGNRLAIQSWRATVSASHLSGADGDTDEIMRVDTFVDVKKMRRDHFCRMPLKNRVNDRRYVTIRSTNGFREYEYSETPDPLSLKFALVFRDVTKMRTPPTMSNIIQYDPRSIGNFPNGALSPANGPDGTIKTAGFPVVDVSRDKLPDGTLCLKVRKKDSNDSLATYWASVDEGFSIRRYLFDVSDAVDPTHVEQTDTEVERWKDTRIWVPVSTKYTQTYKNVLQVNEVAQITWHSINQPIDPDLFEPITFSGLGPGTHVYDVHEMLGPKRRMIWNGRKIVDEDVRPAVAGEVDEIATTSNGGLSRSQLLLIINAAVFVVIAGLFLWRSIRTSSK